MFSGRRPGGYTYEHKLCYVIVISANIIHILICDTVFDNVLYHIYLPASMVIMHGLTSTGYTLYFRLYRYFVFLIKCIGISTTLEATCRRRT